MNQNILRIAVTGNPNQGKTSLVANLAYDDSLKISNKSGETQKSAISSLVIDNEIIYELFDTPGFNNAEDIRDFIQESSDKNIITILNKCIEDKKNDKRFALDLEILEVLIESDIILYIVDDSEYSPASKPSLDIIKSISKPSFLIFNNKKDKHKNDSWSDVVNEYFLSSYNYNVLTSDINDKVNIFNLFKDYITNKEILDRLEIAINKQNDEYDENVYSSFYYLGESLYEIMNYSKTYKNSIIKAFDENDFEKDINKDILKIENEFYKNILAVWGFNGIRDNIERNSFDKKIIKNSSIFGLNKLSIFSFGAFLSCISFILKFETISLLIAIITVFFVFIFNQYNGPGKQTNIKFKFTNNQDKNIFFARMYLFILYISKKNYADKKDIIIKKKDYDVSFLFNRNILKELDILFSLNNKDEFMEKLTLISEDL